MEGIRVLRNLLIYSIFISQLGAATSTNLRRILIATHTSHTPGIVVRGGLRHNTEPPQLLNSCYRKNSGYINSASPTSHLINNGKFISMMALNHSHNQARSVQPAKLRICILYALRACSVCMFLQFGAVMLVWGVK